MVKVTEDWRWEIFQRDVPHWPRCSIPMNRENWITGDKDVTWNRWQRNVKHYYILIILYRSRSPWNLGQASGRRHDATCPASSWSTWPTTIARLLCRVRRTASTSAFTHRRLVAHATYCPKTDIKNTGIRIRLTFILSAADEVTQPELWRYFLHPSGSLHVRSRWLVRTYSHDGQTRRRSQFQLQARSFR